jgi:hypothetical protein
MHADHFIDNIPRQTPHTPGLERRHLSLGSAHANNERGVFVGQCNELESSGCCDL